MQKAATMVKTKSDNHTFFIFDPPILSLSPVQGALDLRGHFWMCLYLHSTPPVRTVPEDQKFSLRRSITSILFSG
jgi:hypothetical protein